MLLPKDLFWGRSYTFLNKFTFALDAPFAQELSPLIFNLPTY